MTALQNGEDIDYVGAAGEIDRRQRRSERASTTSAGSRTPTSRRSGRSTSPTSRSSRSRETKIEHRKGRGRKPGLFSCWAGAEAALVHPARSLSLHEILVPWPATLGHGGKGLEAGTARERRLFSICNKRELARVARWSRRSRPRRRSWSRQGDPGNECFVIAEGRAKATMRGKGSAVLGPGSFFGEMSLLDQGPRSATVTAETDMHLLVLGSANSQRWWRRCRSSPCG